MPELASAAALANNAPDLDGSLFMGARPDTSPNPNRSNSAKFEAALNAGTALENAEAIILEALGNNPAASSALQELLARTDITAENKSVILNHLAEIASQPLKGGLETHKAEFLASLLAELAVPDSIHQDSKATCTVTEEERDLCKNDPARYAEIMAGLSIHGQAALFHGYKMHLNADALEADRPGNLPARDLSLRIFQASALNFAAGLKGGHYSNSSDRATAANGERYSGIFDAQQQILTYALRGQATERIDLPAPADDAIIAKLQQDAAQHGGVRIKIEIRNGGVHENHRVIVDRIENGLVYFHNPWGAEVAGGPQRRYEWDQNHSGRPGKMEVMTVTELKSCMLAVFAPVEGALRITPSLSEEGYLDENGVRQLQISPGNFKELKVAQNCGPLAPWENPTAPADVKPRAIQPDPAAYIVRARLKEDDEISPEQTLASPQRDPDKDGREKSWFDGKQP